MEKQKKTKCKPMRNSYGNGCGGGFYILGFIGAVIYYVSSATTFWGIVLAILKALIWPAFLVYNLLKFTM